MTNRWVILGVLFVVRLTMAFQFQSVAAVAPLLGPAFSVSLADVGLLIGLYFSPGVALALPGGAIAQRFGDKRTVLAALVLMLGGGLAMSLSPSWHVQLAGRLVAGAGGVLLNVQMTKMIADWFAGREIATAMAIFVNSWPTGIGISLLTLPAIGTAYGISAVYLAVVASIAFAIILLGAAYRAPPNAMSAAVVAGRLDRHAVMAVIAAGLTWGFFNTGFATILSFGPSLLVERGWSITAAGSIISLVLWLSALTVPLGGWLADRTGRPQLVLVVSCLLFAMLMLALPRQSAVVAVAVGLGLFGGPPAGPIMSLPARVLQPATRAIGMGLFYTVYYLAMMLGPMIGGALAKATGTSATAFDFGAAMALACPLLLLAFNRTAAARTQSA